MLGQLSAQDQVTRLSGSESILCFSSRLPDFVPNYLIRHSTRLNVLLFALSSKPGGYNLERALNWVPESYQNSGRVLSASRQPFHQP